VFRALKKFHVQHIEQSWTQIVNPVGERSFMQSAQRNVARLLLGRRALSLIGELLGGARVAEPDGYVVDRMDVIQAAFAGLESNPHHEQVVIFQEEMVVGFLLDGNRCGSGSFLGGKEREKNKRGRDTVPKFHGVNLSREEVG
jgi:hypothetical protein